MTCDHDDILALVRKFNSVHEPNVESQALVLAEETGEACEAVLALNRRKLFKGQGSTDDLAHELADVVYVAYSVADIAGIDDLTLRVVETAQRNLNRQR